MMDKPQVFVSYSRADKDIAKRIVSMLEREDIPVWTDRELEAGSDWIQEIEAALSTSSVIVMLLSPRYLDSSTTSFERALALKTAMDTNKTVLPVLVKPVDPDSIPASLRRVQMIDATRNVDMAAKELQHAITSAA